MDANMIFDQCQLINSQSEKKHITNMSLSGLQCRELQDALIDAFPNIASLEQMLAYELDGKNLRAIAGEGSLQNIVFKLIQAANSQDWVEDLVRAACTSNPGNQLLKVIAEELLANNNSETHKVSSSNISQKQSVQPLDEIGAQPQAYSPMKVSDIQGQVRKILLIFVFLCLIVGLGSCFLGLYFFLVAVASLYLYALTLTALSLLSRRDLKCNL